MSFDTYGIRCHGCVMRVREVMWMIVREVERVLFVIRRGTEAPYVGRGRDDGRRGVAVEVDLGVVDFEVEQQRTHGQAVLID